MIIFNISYKIYVLCAFIKKNLSQGDTYALCAYNKRLAQRDTYGLCA